MKENDVKPTLEHFAVLFNLQQHRSETSHLIPLLTEFFDTQSPETLAKFTKLPHPPEVSSFISLAVSLSALGGPSLVKQILMVQ